MAVSSFLRDLTLIITGGALGLITNWAIYRIRRQNSRKSLRLALKTEIESEEVLDDWVENYPHGDTLHAPKVDAFPSEVYSANAGDLGLLSSDEREAVVAYYSFADVVSQQIQILSKKADEGTHSREDYDTLHEAADDLRDRRDKAHDLLT